MADAAWKQFEREIARRVGEWWCEDGKAFVRTARSGAWPRKKADGDVVAADERMRLDFPICIDGKHRKGPWDLDKLLTSKKHELLAWWHEMGEIDKVKEGKYRWLIASKRGIADSVLVLGRKEMHWLVERVGNLKALPRIEFEVGGVEDPNFETEKLTIVGFLAFLDLVDAEALGGPKHEKG